MNAPAAARALPDVDADVAAGLDAERARAGGKAAGLLLLQRAGAEVPPFVGIDAALLDAWSTAAALDGAPDDVTARALLAKTPAPPALVGALRAARAALPAGPLAVRSSALDEDSTQRSHAGQLESVLFVDGDDAVVEAVARCLASTLSARARTYRHAHGESAARPRLGVVVQAMVEGDVSGVAFTADPTTGDRDRITVAAAHGLCEGVVQGSVGADTYTVSRATREIAADVVDKPEQVIRATSGTRLAPVPAESVRAAVLHDASLRALVDVLVKIEGALGFPLDVEWTRVDGRFVLLQVRPITTITALSSSAAALGARELHWDNANIVESFSGPTTALTFSYIRFAYSVAYQQSCEIGGLPADEVKANQRTFQSMLGFHDGRVYYNLQSWYALLSLFPGFEKNAAHMERMMGVRESARLLAQAPRRTAWQRLGIGLAWLRNLRSLDALVLDFESRLKTTLEEWPASRFSSMSLTDLSDAYHALVWRLLWHWQAPLVTDFAAMLSFGITVDLIKKWKVDESGALANDLLGGEGDVASLEPTRSLLRLADAARAHNELRALLVQTPEPDCLPALRAQPQHAAFTAAVHEHLARWGDRCIGELKLEEPSLAERPDFLFAMLKNYLRQDGTSAPSMEEREQDRRRAAEQKLSRALPLHKRVVVFWFLRQARKHMKNREGMRFGRTRTFALLRQLVLRAGDILVEARRLDDRDDVFHLTIDELVGFIDGTAVSGDLRGLAAVRKAEHVGHLEAADPPDRFVTRGAAGLAARVPYVDVHEGDANTLKGTPCSPGRVRGKVRVIHDPKGGPETWRVNGEILVAARTDPGWVPLYPSASGLLVERGSPLSHSAIVARELGLPTIVNIPGLLARIHDGDTVEMDGASGTVTVVTP